MYPRTIPHLFPLGEAGSARSAGRTPAAEPPSWVLASAEKDVKIKEVLLADLRNMMPVDYAFQKAADSRTSAYEVASENVSTEPSNDSRISESSAAIINAFRNETAEDVTRSNLGVRSVYRAAATRALPNVAASPAVTEDDELPPYGYEAQSFNDIDMVLKPLCSLCDTVPRIQVDDQPFVHECFNGHLLCSICTKNICKVNQHLNAPSAAP